MKRKVVILILSFTLFSPCVFCQDSDGDGVANEVDSDSDNDGISDFNECSANSAAMAVTGNTLNTRSGLATNINEATNGGYPVSVNVSDPGNRFDAAGVEKPPAEQGERKVELDVSGSVGASDVYEGCEIRVDFSKGFDDGITVEIDGVVILDFGQPNYLSGIAFFNTGPFGKGQRFDSDLGGFGWWPGEGNTEMVITDGNIQIFADVHPSFGGGREDIIPYLTSRPDRGAPLVVNKGFTLDCRIPFNFSYTSNSRGGGGHNMSASEIDINMFVCADTDGDGITNNLDSDSDGDGCADAIEGGGGDADNDGYLGTSPIAVNAAGEIIGASYPALNPDVIAIGPDIDGDGISDACDTVDFNCVNGPSLSLVSVTDRLCLGDNDGTADVDVSGGTLPYFYSWNDPAFQNTQDASNIGAGTYRAFVVDANDCGDTLLVTLNEFPLPIINAGPDQEICLGDTVRVSASGGQSYAWDNGVIDGLPIIPSETVKYAVLGTDINGCAGIDTVNITVNMLPSVSAGDDQVLCVGSDLVLEGSGAVNYIWSDGLLDGVASVPAVGLYIHTVTGTDGKGCVNTDEVTIEVVNLPNVMASDDFSVCDGTDVTLFGVGALTYNWDMGVIDGESFKPSVSQAYSVNGVDENGCEGSDDILVTVMPNPEVSFSADVLSGCYPIEVNFTNTSASSGVDCIWYIENEEIASCDGVTHVFDAPGFYDVSFELETSNGCRKKVTYEEYIEVNDYPVASFYPNPNKVVFLEGETKMFNTSSGASSYSWNFGDGGTSNQAGPFHRYYDGIGTYNITLIATSEAGCSDTTNADVEVIDDLLYYVPNTFTPDGDQFNEIFMPVFNAEVDIYDYHMTIFNRWGEVVFESFDLSVGWDGTYGSEGLIQDGVYVWKIDFGEIRSDKRHYIDGHITLMK